MLPFPDVGTVLEGVLSTWRVAQPSPPFVSQDETRVPLDKSEGTVKDKDILCGAEALRC
jgi:hypothetical protein